MSIEREVIGGAEVPSGIGPYSPAVRAGDLLYVSGQPGVDPETAKPVGPGFAEQARQAFENLGAVLRISIGCVAIVAD
jgi:2-iminobutanoate/2-iminopropanoate deaminase